MNRIAFYAAPLLLAPLVGGCITIRTVDDGIVRARIDETVAIGGTQVTPVRVIEDSRCPAGVQCISAGQVRIAVRIGGGEAVELTQNQGAALAGGSLTLVEVYPPRRKDWTIYPDEYRFGFSFTRQPVTRRP